MVLLQPLPHDCLAYMLMPLTTTSTVHTHMQIIVAYMFDHGCFIMGCSCG